MRKFLIDRTSKEKEPTKEQIARQKDFSRLHHDYEKLSKRSKKRLYQDPKLWMLLFIVGLVIFLMVLES
jgi:hypothetical protein